MPTFFQHGVLIHFAAFTRHVGVYPPVTDPTLAFAAHELGHAHFPGGHVAASESAKPLGARTARWSSCARRRGSGRGHAAGRCRRGDAARQPK
jgi:hypothetical protein